MPLVSEFARIALFSGVIWVVWRISNRLLGRSALDNIPGPPSKSLITGNLTQMFDRNGWNFMSDIGEKYGSVVKTRGIFGRIGLYVFDPTALSAIVVKDQYLYDKPEESYITSHLILGDGLLAISGEPHRRQRKLLNPVFSINNMRQMTHIFYRICDNLRDAISLQVKNGSKEIDMLDWMSRTALELIGQAGLGYSFDPLVEERGDAYGDAIKSIVPSFVPLRYFRTFLPFIMKIGTTAFRRYLLERAPFQALQFAREVSDLLDEHSRRIFYEKKAALERGDEAVLKQVGEGKDILSKLIQANMSASEEDRLSESELLGQMSTFIFAGMDTTSGALAHTLYLLAQHPDIQEKMRKEIMAAYGEDRDIPYNKLVELPYLDAVCRETLRLYAPVVLVNRRAKEDMILPLSAPIQGVDGRRMKEIPVPRGTYVTVGILAANRNPKLWGPDAAEWKPERWLSPLPEALVAARVPGVYSNLMTFLGGGRACIGFKFSQLEMKVVLAVLLSTFRFSLSDKPIHWNLAGIQYPTVGLDSNKPEMPMKVSLLKKE